MRGLPRLSSATLAQARAGRVPTFDRSVAPTLAHIGVGAFARAHLGVYADDLGAYGWPAVIRGVSLRGRRAEDQLAPQDGLYTVAERDDGPDAPLRVIGSIGSVQTGWQAAVDAIAAPTTAMVTVTITEKGYDIVPEGLHDPARPRSAPAVVALGLARRHAAGLSPPIVASLDNLVHNGELLRARVVEVAEQLDPKLSQWVDESVQFPNSVVDRLVPVVRVDDVVDISQRLALQDLAAVACERHRSWVITATEGLPPFADVGVQVTDDIAPFERRKLWLLNAPHSAFAYCGLLAGCDTISAATEHPEVARFVRLLVDEILTVVDLPRALDARSFASEALQRFQSRQLRDACLRVAADGSRKLPQRLFPVVAARQLRGLDTSRFAVVAGLWIAAAAELPVKGARLPVIDDPDADGLRAAAIKRDLRRLSRAAIGDHADVDFIDQVGGALQRITREGIAVLGTVG